MHRSKRTSLAHPAAAARCSRRRRSRAHSSPSSGCRVGQRDLLIGRREQPRGKRNDQSDLDEGPITVPLSRSGRRFSSHGERFRAYRGGAETQTPVLFDTLLPFVVRRLTLAEAQTRPSRCANVRLTSEHRAALVVGPWSTVSNSSDTTAQLTVNPSPLNSIAVRQYRGSAFRVL